MRSACKYSFFSFALLCLTAQAQQKTNPHTQIAWPANCSGAHMFYNYVTNVCVATADISGVVPGPTALCANGTAGALTQTGCTIPAPQVTWPASCATGTYVPATNTCVATGTAANPAGTAAQVQYNAGGGTFGAASTFTFNSGTNTLNTTNVSATNSTSSANNIIFVGAPPYNAKCDGATDDRAAIQAAFDDARTKGYTVQFPAGTCVTSTIVWKGQTFFGAGPQITVIKGKPGQDVFQGPDPFNYPSFAQVHDLQILVDDSVNASATAGGGNNTFPNRITGTYGGTTPIPANLGGPPAPGPLIFGTTVSGGCAVNATATTTAVTASCGNFAATANLLNQPITVTGAGAAGGLYSGTITGVTNTTTLAVSPAISTTVTSASATMGTPNSPPWYIGNCGIAVPAAAMNGAGGVNGWQFRNVWFLGTSGQNHSCGVLMTAQSNQIMWENVTFRVLWAGLIEYPPATGQVWGNITPDTSSYKDVNFEILQLPLVWYAGIHRNVNNMSIYAGNGAFGLGPFMFQTAAMNATFSAFYYECWSLGSGELERFGGSVNFNDESSSLAQCGMTNQYANFVGSSSTSNANVQNIHIFGSGNKFRHTCIAGQTCSMQVTDAGIDNEVISDAPVNGPRQATVNRALPPVGLPDAGFIAMGNSATPFTNMADLKSTCYEWPFMYAAPNNAPGCISDIPTGASVSGFAASGNPFGSYGRLTKTNYPSGFSIGNQASQGGAGPWGKWWLIGDRIPQAKMNLIIMARCDAACTQLVTVTDNTAANKTIGTATLSFGTSWTIQSLAVDASSANGTSVGDLTSLGGGALGGAGVNYEDIAVIAFEPINTDTITAAASSSTMQRTIQGNISTGNFYMAACNMTVGNFSGAPVATCAADTTSPYSQQSEKFTATAGFYRISGYNGTTLTIGNQIQQNATYTVSIMSYAAVGYSESISVLCAATVVFTGSLTHGTAYPAVTSPGLFTIPFTNAACVPGAAIQISVGGVTNDTFIGSINFSPVALVSIPTAINQVPVSALSGALQYNTTKLLAGAGTGIVTGPTTSVSGNVVTYTGTAGQVADSGTLLTNVPIKIANGTSAMGTSLITTGTCATVVTTAAAGAATTDSVAWSFAAAPGTGYTAGLHVFAYPTSANVNFLVCNPTAGSLTPAAATLNWRITR